MSMSELDTRAKLIDPKLHESGWTEENIERDKSITKGKIINESGDRLPPRIPDYILYYPNKTGIPIAIVEAKAEDKPHLAGMQQAKEYRRILGVPFAYSTNGHKIEEYDDFTKKQKTLKRFPSPQELWGRYVANKELEGIGRISQTQNPLIYPYYPFPDKPIRYYQEVAIKNAIEAILKGEKRILLAMATGSGKTYVAFQIAWKLYKTRKIRRVLYVVDRIFLRRQAHDAFWPFRTAREELTETKSISKTKDIYFATYQTLYAEKNGKRIYQLFDPDFFDLVIIDECHRSGWKRWHDILKHFSNAIHLGLTATPKRTDNIDTYKYFKYPAYEYPLKQGVEDGFLAPFEVIRVFTNIDKAGRLSLTEVRTQGGKVEIPPDIELKEYYSAEEFERDITIPDRTRVICDHIAKILESTGPKSKTVIFCVSQLHAAEVAKELNNRFAPVFGVENYAVRIVTDEPRAHQILKEFGNSEKVFPVVATTVDLLSTGVDIPPVKNIVFLKVINSKVVFDQTIGRGSRVDENSGKFYFRIIDYTNATRLFDEWDITRKRYAGPSDWFLACKIIDIETGSGIPNASVVALPAPSKPITIKTDREGCFLLNDMPRGSVKIDVRASGYKGKETNVPTFPTPSQNVVIGLEREVKKKKTLVKVENVEVFIEEEGILKFDVLGNKLKAAEYIEYCKDGICERIVTYDDLKEIWKERRRRLDFKKDLEKRGINLGLLAKLHETPDADEFDLLAHIVFNAPIVSRDERARALLEAKRAFFEKHGLPAREVLLELVDRYKRLGIDEITTPKVFNLTPFNKMGGLMKVIEIFGGIPELKRAIAQIESGLYPELETAGLR